MVGLHDEFVTQLEIRGRSRGAVGVGARLEGDDLFALGVVSVDLTAGFLVLIREVERGHAKRF